MAPPDPLDRTTMFNDFGGAAVPSGDGEGASDRPALGGDRLLVASVRRAGPWLGPLVVLALLDAAATLALPALVGRAVDQAVDATREGHGSLAPGGLVAAIAGLLVLLIVTEALTLAAGGYGTARTTGALRRRLVRHVLAAGPPIARRTGAGDLVARLVSSTATASQAVVVVAGLAAALIPPVGAVVALALIDPWLAATFAAGMVAVSLAVGVYLRNARTATDGYVAAQGAIAARLVEALSGARTIAASGTVDREAARVLVPLPSLARHGTAMWRSMARLAVQGEPGVQLTQLAVVAVAGLGLAAGRLTAGELLAAGRYAVLAAGIGGVIDELAAVTRARAGAQRVAEVLAEPVLAYGERTLAPGPGRLELRGVTAGPDGAPVLRGLDLVVPAGRVVALVGRSGAGKSVVAALAGRLLDPDEGEVRLDGAALPELDHDGLRRSVTYAFERPEWLGDTVADAIGFGVDTPSAERLESAARSASADRFISRLPGGYEASLAGTPLSGGELQRIGLARAFAHDARLLILDDATSSLDTATEAEISAALTTGGSGRTHLIVTHRAATAARADAVVWLDAGRVRAFGPHHDLWADPEYRAVFGVDDAPPAAEGAA
jgi:ATP-binding cassette subfamily B protein